MFTPRQYQIEGRDFLKARRYALLGDAPGVGKTGQACLAIEPEWKVLIVCPASVKEQWREALIAWRGFDSRVIYKAKEFKYHPRTIVNYDLLVKDELLKKLRQPVWDVIVFDEAHKLKSVDAKRTRAALGKDGIKNSARRMWFMTGTPVKNRTIDLYPILRTCASEFIEPYTSYAKFAYRFCGAFMGRFGLDTSGASNTDDLRNRLKGFMLRREKRDVLTELPPRVITHIKFECTATVKNIIREQEEKTSAQADDISQKYDDPNEVYCRVLDSLKLGEIGRIRKALAYYKVEPAIEYIKDLLEEEDKIVIFYHHTEVRYALERRLSAFAPVYIDGSVHPSKRSGVVARFNTVPEVRVFLGQMEASGEGIDGLQHSAATCVFVEPSWSHTDIEQCIGRLERSGQRNDINVHILTIKDTLEAKMLDAIAEKLKTDKALYGQNQQTKENEMAEDKKMSKEEAQGKLAEAFGFALVQLIKGAVKEAITETLIPATQAEVAAEEAPAAPAPVKKGKAEPAEVVQDEEKDVTEEAIRTRAGDVCEIDPDKGRDLCAKVISDASNGGKIKDLKTAEQRVKCFEGLDALYNKLASKKQKSGDM